MKKYFIIVTIVFIHCCMCNIKAQGVDYSKYIYPIKDKETELYGFVDLEGNMIIPCQYDKVDYDWALGYTCLPLWIDVYSGDKKGYVNMQTRHKIEPINLFKKFGLTNAQKITYWFHDDSHKKEGVCGIYVIISAIWYRL